MDQRQNRDCYRCINGQALSGLGRSPHAYSRRDYLEIEGALDSTSALNDQQSLR